jgi:hypothetical protein
MEHYVTLFDDKYLPQGLALHASLMQHASPFHLWILAMNSLAARQLKQLDVPNITVIPFDEVETPELGLLKSSRSWAEFCYTVTPFSIETIFSRCAEARRVTYVDADVFLFQSPAPFFLELEAANKQVLITEHAFDPKFTHHGALYGRFCVQFMTFYREKGGLKVLSDWFHDCLNWSTSGSDNSRFSDQTYLDNWPRKYGDVTHILTQRNQTLAPWNVDYYMKLAGHEYFPVLYHFQGFRIIRPRIFQLSSMFKVKFGNHIYKEYLKSVQEQCQKLISQEMPMPVIPLRGGLFWWFWLAKRCIFQNLKVRRWQG